MRGHFLVLFFGVLLLVMSPLAAQPSIVTFCYYDDGQDPPEPPITDGAGQPVPDGTEISIMRDLGEAGPDTTDTVLLMSSFNGDVMGIGTGYFFTDPALLAEIGISVYLGITAVGRCWYTVTVTISPGPQELCYAADEWTSGLPSCLWHRPTATVVWSYCIHPPWYLERPIGCPCENPGNDTYVAVMHDVNTNGPDGVDTVLTSFVALENVPDCIWVSPEVTLPTDFPVYLQIGQECCWTTADYIVAPGEQGIELWWQSWNCASAPCALSAKELPPAVHPDRVEITGAYPNPFNSVTQIELTVPHSGMVKIEIYNIAGQLVRTLAHDTFFAGVHRLTWDARSDANLPVGSGLYLCRAVSHRSAVTKKLLLLQ